MKNNLEEQKIKILRTLQKARGPAPLGYISLHSRIDNPSEILSLLERENLISRTPLGLMNLSLMPMFECTSEGKKILAKIDDYYPKSKTF